MNNRVFTVSVLVLVVMSIYLFVTAPPPLESGDVQVSSDTISVETLFTILQAENSIARTIYTRDIVGAGTEVGLAFDENWRSSAVAAGPLPALFLRETASNLERSPIPISLFLGSEFPIETSNRFNGPQLASFHVLEDTGNPQFLYAEDVARYTGMFPDVAVAQPCVTCHNEHPNTPKTDWELGDIMGATTWMYPSDRVSVADALEIVGTLRDAIEGAYEEYLAEASTFDPAPEVGELWPADGYYLPSAEVFVAAVVQEASTATLESFIGE